MNKEQLIVDLVLAYFDKAGMLPPDSELKRIKEIANQIFD